MIDGLPKPAKSSSAFDILFPIVLFAAFLLQGISLIPYLGIQNDEALISGALYDPARVTSLLSVFKHKIPMMQMNYLGALKAWIFYPIFLIWKPSVYSLRIPALLLGGATVWLFYRLLVRVSGRGAAVMGSLLLATDAIFLLTTCFDWGPVVLQHLLLVIAVLLLTKFHQTGSRASLAGGFCAIGLALWDKALFGWTLTGMVVAALVVFPGTIRRYITRRNAVVAVCWFAIGAYPLLRHNVRHRFETFRSNVGYTTENLNGKVFLLRSSLEGAGLFGYFVFNDPGENPQPPRTAVERLSLRLSKFAGEPLHTPLPYALFGALLVLPFLWNTPARKPMLFAFICAGVAWVQMLFARGGGGSVHHTALLWPWPQFFLACALAGISQRFRKPGAAAAWAVAVLLCVSNLLVTNQYRTEFFQNGGAGSWTDATGPLYDFLERAPVTRIFITDWGMYEPMRLLSRDRLPLFWAAGPILDDIPEEARLREFREMADTPGSFFVAHTDAFEEFHPVNERLRALSARAGYRRQMLRTIFDRNGRPVFEVFRFERQDGSVPLSESRMSRRPAPGSACRKG